MECYLLFLYEVISKKNYTINHVMDFFFIPISLALIQCKHRASMAIRDSNQVRSAIYRSGQKNLNQKPDLFIKHMTQLELFNIFIK